MLDLGIYFWGVEGGKQFLLAVASIFPVIFFFLFFFRSIFSHVPTHLTTGPTKNIPPYPGKTGGTQEPNITATLWLLVLL